MATIAAVEEKYGCTKRELEDRLDHMGKFKKHIDDAPFVQIEEAYLQDARKALEEFELAKSYEQALAAKAEPGRLTIIGHNLYSGGRKVAGLQRTLYESYSGSYVYYYCSDMPDILPQNQRSPVCMLAKLVKWVQAHGYPYPIEEQSFKLLQELAYEESSPIWQEMLESAIYAAWYPEILAYKAEEYRESRWNLLEIWESRDIADCSSRLLFIQITDKVWDVLSTSVAEGKIQLAQAQEAVDQAYETAGLRNFDLAELYREMVQKHPDLAGKK